jgi:hypothetical protein
MYLSIPTNTIRLVERVLGDLNVRPIEAHLPVIGGNQLINIRDDQVAKNLIHQLKSLGITPGLVSTA